MDPDRAHEQANNPDSFGFCSEMSLGSFQQAQLFKAQRDEARSLLEAFKEAYGLEGVSNEEIKEYMADTLTQRVKDSFETQEGFDALKRETMKHYGIGAEPVDPMVESRNVFTQAQRRRLQADRKMFEPPEEE